MALDNRQSDLESLRIDRSQNGAEIKTPLWARRYIQVGVGIVLLLIVIRGLSAVLAGNAVEVETSRASGETNTVLSASGYIVAHHKINVNSKVTGRVSSISVEKGDKVKQGQVLVRLEDQEFRAQTEQARGLVQTAAGRVHELENGSRPEEIQQAEHNLSEARATMVDDKISLDRTKDLFSQGVSSKQALDDATAKYGASQQRVNSLEQGYQLAKIGPRAEQIEQARGSLTQAKGQLAYAQSQLDATVIRAPVSGTILERTAEKGELITAQFASAAEGGPVGSVVALADLNDLQVELDISQDDFARLGAKQKGIVSVDAFPDRKYDGVIAEISPEANRQKATVQVKVQILNPDEFLRPEMNASVRFLPKDGEAAGGSGVFVPTSALRTDSGKKFVFVVTGNRVDRRDITVIGPRSGGFAVTGIKEGDTVVTTAPATLKDGNSIKIKGQK
jgi:HlyD family secretion protein